MLFMVNLEFLRDELSSAIQQDNLINKPSYYKKIIEDVFDYPEIPKLLRHQIIVEKDESFSMFLNILEKYFDNSKEYKIAIFCSGSGLLTKIIKSRFQDKIVAIHDFDFKENMLTQDKFAEKKYLVDLSKQINLNEKYDIIISLGNLRYFSNCLSRFKNNIQNLLSYQGYFFVGEVDYSLIQKFVGLINRNNYAIKFKSTNINIFRNTLFYMLYYNYKTDKIFRNIIITNSPSKEEIVSTIIKLAGFKTSNYFYIIGKKIF